MQTVLNIPAVSSSVGFIAGTVASLPIRLYRTEGENSVEVKDDYRLRLLNADTGDLLDAFQWKCTLVRDYLLPGNGYTYVDWAGNRIEGLYYVDPLQVSAESWGPIRSIRRPGFTSGEPVIRTGRSSGSCETPGTALLAPGWWQKSPTQLETMLNALQYENHMVRTGSKKGFLKAKNRLAPEIITQLKNSWRKLYGNSSEENVVVLNDGIEFQDAGQNAVDSQLNENKITNDHEIYKIFCIVPSVLEGGATEEDLKNTVRFAIQPVVQALQTAINRYCLLESEKGTLAFEVDLDVLDNTDMLSRYQAYEVAVRNGWMQLDEVRYEEGRNPLGLKFIRLGLDTVIYDPETQMIYTPNTKEWAKVEQKGGGDPGAGGNQS